MIQPASVKVLTELLARLESAEGLNPKLFWSVADACIPNWSVPDDRLHSQLAGFVDAGAWTDAALALVERVLPGWAWMTGCAPDGGYFCEMQPTVDDEMALGGTDSVFAKTPALALLIALVRALISQSRLDAERPSEPGEDL